MLRPSSAIAAALALAAQCLVVSSAAAQDFRDRPEVTALKAELVAEHGFDAAALDATFARIKRLDRVVALMDAPIRAPTPWHHLLAAAHWWRPPAAWQRVSAPNRASFESAAHAYGVPEHVIAAIIGVETVYGRITGNFRVVDALATLAFDYPRRADFFRGELKDLLLLARAEQVTVRLHWLVCRRDGLAAIHAGQLPALGGGF